MSGLEIGGMVGLVLLAQAVAVSLVVLSRKVAEPPAARSTPHQEVLCAAGSPDQSTAPVGGQPSKLDHAASLVRRLVEIRSGGTEVDSPFATASPLKITDEDMMLVGSDQGTAQRNHPAVDLFELYEGRWFAAAKRLDPRYAGHNYHGERRKDGTLKIETLYVSLPKSKYQAAPEEVVWHMMRVLELRAQGVPVEERVRIMATEARSTPWAAAAATEGVMPGAPGGGR